MKLNFKEDPKEWRKSALLTVLGLAVISLVLRWRKPLPPEFCLALSAMLGLVAVCVGLRPRWFRGWYRLSLRLGFYSSRFIGRCVLAAFFFCIVTPLGLGLRLAGKDPLQLKPPRGAKTCWHPARESSSLERLF